MNGRCGRSGLRRTVSNKKNDESRGAEGETDNAAGTRAARRYGTLLGDFCVAVELMTMPQACCRHVYKVSRRGQSPALLVGGESRATVKEVSRQQSSEAKILTFCDITQKFLYCVK